MTPTDQEYVWPPCSEPKSPDYYTDTAWKDLPKTEQERQTAAFDEAMSHPYGYWADVPFVVAWACWSLVAAIPVAIGEGIGEHLFIHDSPTTSFVGWLVATFAVGLIVTVVTRCWHGWMVAWDKSICRRLGLDCDSGYTKDAPPINVDDKIREDMDERMRWREADARNGIHRMVGADEVKSPTIKRSGERWRGHLAPRQGALHHFTFSIGFRHEKSEDSRVREED